MAINCTPNRVNKIIPLELLIGKEARLFGLVPVVEKVTTVDVPLLRAMEKLNMEKNANYDKIRFDCVLLKKCVIKLN